MSAGSGNRRVEDLYMLKTRNVVLQNTNGSYAPRNSVFVVGDSKGHMKLTQSLVVNDVSATTIEVGDLSASTINVGDLSASTINVGDLSASTINVGDLSASTIGVGDLSATNISFTGQLTGPGLVTDLTAPTGSGISLTPSGTYNESVAIATNFVAGAGIVLTPSITPGDTTLTIAAPSAGSGVASITAGSSHQVSVSAPTGAVTIDLSGNFVNSIATSGNLLSVSGGSTANPTVTGTLTAGSGVSISGSSGALTVTNSGVRSLAAGSDKITVSNATGAVTVDVSGNFVTGVTGGTGITVSGGTSTSPVVAANIVAGGTGITVDTSGSAVRVTNAGVTSITGGSGIGLNYSRGNVTITNAGVAAITAGAGISVSAPTGGVIVGLSENITGKTVTLNPGVSGSPNSHVDIQALAGSTQSISTLVFTANNSATQQNYQIAGAINGSGGGYTEGHLKIYSNNTYSSSSPVLEIIPHTNVLSPEIIVFATTELQGNTSIVGTASVSGVATFFNDVNIHTKIINTNVDNTINTGPTCGVAQLNSSGTYTIATTSVTAHSIILCTYQLVSPIKPLTVSSIVGGVSATITGDNNAYFNWLMIN